MMFLRPWFRRKFGPYMKNLTVQETEKYLSVLRLIYFFGMGSLCFMVYGAKKKYDQKMDEIKGKPPTFGDRLKDKLPPAVVYDYRPGKGMTKIYFDKDEYYKQLEEEAYQKAKKAQEKVLAEGRPLPEGSINLVE